MEWIPKITVFWLLYILCRQDLSSMQIQGEYLLLPPVLGCLELLAGREGRGAAEALLSLLPGIFLEAVSHISGGAVGEGDALLFWSLGYMLTLENLYCLAFLSFLLTAAGGLAVRRKKRMSAPTGQNQDGNRVPLLPALLAVYALIPGAGGIP